MYNSKAYTDLATDGLEAAICDCPSAIFSQGAFPCPVVDCSEVFHNTADLISHIALMIFAESQSGFDVACIHR